jgi:hypothetical protein
MRWSPDILPLQASAQGMNAKSLPPIFVCAIAAYPVLYIAAANPGQAEGSTIALVVLASVLAALAAWVALMTLARSSIAAGFATALLVVMFYGYGQVGALADQLVIWLELGDDATPNALDLWPRARLYIALAWALLALIATTLLARSRFLDKTELARAANVAAAVLAITLAVPWTINVFSGLSARSAVTVENAGSATGPVEGSKRDIYFIILDGYAREDVLKGMYAFDNRAFIQGLRTLGFRVTDSSSSNYSWTFLSVASMLNMAYLQDFLPPGQLSPRNVDRSAVYAKLRDNATAGFLREQGYEIVHVRSTWGATSANPDADREIRCESGVYTNEFLRAVVEASWWGAFHSKASVDLALCNLSNFRTLAAMRPTLRPKFVFAHFILPHHPYLFDRDGNILRNAQVSNQFELQSRLWEDRDRYRSQLEFVNGKVTETIRAMLANYDLAPIVVIASDHGPNLKSGLTEAGHLAVRFANFGAYYLPGAPHDLIPHSGTAVNQFRRILGHYFGANLPPLADRHFVSSFSKPYDFREVPHEKLLFWWTRLDPSPQSAPTAPRAPPGEKPANESAH